MRTFFMLLQATLLVSAGLYNNIALAQDEFSELNTAYADAPLPSVAREGNWHGLVGGAVIALQQPVADRRGYLLPLVAVTYRDTFFWHFGQLGAYVLNSDDRRARLAIALKARRGYDPADYAALAGMVKRDTSLEAGISGVWRTHAVVTRYSYFSDISGTSHGDSAQLNFSHPFRLAPRWFLAPSLGAEWLSDKLVDYYYGVKPAEATATRPAYTGTASTNLRAGVMVMHLLPEHWLLFGGVGVTRLGSGISDSPIVIHDSIGALHFGGAWYF